MPNSLTGTPVSDTQAFKPGQRTAVKVIGARPIDGLAVLSAKPSVVAEASPAAQLAAGQLVTGRIASIDDKGAVLTLSQGVRSVEYIREATCKQLPCCHTSVVLSCSAYLTGCTICFKWASAILEG
jgi:hypothetical protein